MPPTSAECGRMIAAARAAGREPMPTIRLSNALGGGPVQDTGIHSIAAATRTGGTVEVIRSGPPRP
jgi:hypothetical protein